MAEESVPFDTGPGSIVDEAGWRRMARGFARDGMILALTNEAMISASGGASVTRAACPVGAIVDGFHYRDIAASTKAVTANSSSNPRRDRAVLRLDPAANKVSWEIKLGAPGVNPAPPGLTQDRAGIWEVSLGSWTMPGSASAQVPNSFTDERPRPNGGPLGEVARDSRATQAGPVTALTTIAGLSVPWFNPFDHSRRCRVQFDPLQVVVNGASAVQVTFYRNGAAIGARYTYVSSPNNGYYWCPFLDTVVPAGLSLFEIGIGNYFAGAFTVYAQQPINLSVVDLGPD